MPNHTPEEQEQNEQQRQAGVVPPQHEEPYIPPESVPRVPPVAGGGSPKPMPRPGASDVVRKGSLRKESR